MTLRTLWKSKLVVHVMLQVGLLLIFGAGHFSSTLAKSVEPVTAVVIASTSGSDSSHSPQASETFEAQPVLPTLVQTIDVSSFVPPSTDPTGITYLARTETFIISDSEVDETNYFSNTNIFTMDTSGALVATANTLPFSEEPTAVLVNPDTGHLFIADDNAIKAAAATSDDGERQIHPGPEVTEIDPGPDQRYFTGDDVTRYLPTESFGSSDPEGLAYDPVQKHLLVLDDTAQRFYEISPGANGIFDGVVPLGDDHISSYDLAHLTMTQLKGITYNPSNGHLYLVGKPKDQMVETTITGRLVRVYDISAANPVAPSDLAFGPGSTDPRRVNVYVTDRGADNNAMPNENDGKVYEFALPEPSLLTNRTPTVEAGPDSTIVLPTKVALLNGTVTDDGLPASSGTLSTTWSQLEGPTNVVFGNATEVDTSVTIQEVGVYVLRLRADDGEATASDTVTITVAPQGENASPIVDAGPDQVATVGQVITLTAVISDDGFPDPPGVVESRWSLLNEPEGGEITNTNGLTAQVAFATPGEYIARLSATDGEHTVHDDVTLEILEPEPNRLFLPATRK